jgi:GNAT superfamily N-acetyltransferase
MIADEASDDELRAIAEAYRWQRRLGHRVIEGPGCHIVADAALPEVWDANHVDAVTAETDAEVQEVLAAMDEHLKHTPWRVLHTDCFTPARFLAWLGYLGFEQRPLVVQMSCDKLAPVRPAAVVLKPVVTAADWTAMAGLVRADQDEGKRTGGLELDEAFTAAAIEGYRAKAPSYRFHLALLDGAPVAYGAMVAAPNGLGMIEDLFTLPSARRRGIASTMIAHFDTELRAAGCRKTFLGAIVEEQAKALYYKLGFRPVMLTRTWVKNGAEGI